LKGTTEHFLAQLSPETRTLLLSVYDRAFFTARRLLGDHVSEQLVHLASHRLVVAWLFESASPAAQAATPSAQVEEITSEAVSAPETKSPKKRQAKKIQQ